MSPLQFQQYDPHGGMGCSPRFSGTIDARYRYQGYRYG